jgi:signal transduction histidine kinase
MGYLAKSLVRRLATRVPTEAETAETILEGIQTAIAEVRRVVRGLAPVELDAFGLRAALQDLARSVSERFAVDCRCNCEADIAVEDNNVATELYRIAQEATNNAIKHARPEHVTMELEFTARDLVLRVRDDGCGMNCDGEIDGMGMRIMRYRSKMIGAEFGVLSSDEGTTVTCKLKRDMKRG